MYWFTGDEHFNHQNIISKFVFRPFQAVEDMNREIIRRHNERVKPGHTVFHLGDFRMSNQGPNVHELMGMLNGNHVFIAGNHDKRNGLNTPLKYAIIQSYGKTILLCHDPADAVILSFKTYFDFRFVGHVHEKWKFNDQEQGPMVNVGVDQWDFCPVDAKQILKGYKQWMRTKRSQ